MEETKFIERTEPLNGETEAVVAEPLFSEAMMRTQGFTGLLMIFVSTEQRSR